VVVVLWWCSGLLKAGSTIPSTSRWRPTHARDFARVLGPGGSLQSDRPAPFGLLPLLPGSCLSPLPGPHSPRAAGELGVV